MASHSLPTFFQQTAYYDEAARAAIRPLLKRHREHRDAIRNGITYPIGHCPDGASWTGLQNHRAQDDAGLLLVFRELASGESTAALPLRFAAGRRIVLTDLLEETTREEQTDAEGRVPFAVADAPGFRFLSYRFAD